MKFKNAIQTVSVFFYNLKEYELFEFKCEYDEVRNTFNSQLLGDYYAIKEKGIDAYLINIDSGIINPFDKIMKQIKE